jgi:protein-L-isoaspartate(D-aspartate) O-methyltransferase
MRVSNNKKFIEQLVQDGRIKTKAIIGAFFKIDRIDFVPDDFKDEAYLDIPIPILSGMTTSQPSTIAFMLEKLQPRRGEKVLEIGTGSGYLTALLATLVGGRGRVFSIEYFPELKNFAGSNLRRYNFKNIMLLVGDGKNGFPQEAPFDKIVSSAEVKEIPRAWEGQLKIGGSLLAPINSKIVLAKKVAKDKFDAEFFSAFSFVPLL